MQRCLQESSKLVNMLKIDSTQVRLYVVNTHNTVDSTQINARLRVLNRAALVDPFDNKLKDVMKELNVSHSQYDPLDKAMQALKSW